MITGFTTSDFIAVDWGTSSFRAYLVRGGVAMARTEAARGILGVEPGQHADVLRALLAGLPCDPARLPILMSGMIGSRQGWREAPYVAAPATLSQLVAGMLSWRETGLGPISLIPGVMQAPADGMPDVMRGEETQVFGALATMDLADGVFIMPGTHSKSIVVRDGVLISFRTFMSGEVYAALKDHTILGRLMEEGPSTGAGFKAGVEAAARVPSAGDALNAIFGTRTLGLLGKLPGTELADYLSGLLIGMELCAALAEGRQGIVIGSGLLTERYVMAGDWLGRHLKAAPADCVVAGQAAILKAMTGQGLR